MTTQVEISAQDEFQPGSKDQVKESQKMHINSSTRVEKVRSVLCRIIEVVRNALLNSSCLFQPELSCHVNTALEAKKKKKKKIQNV